MGDHIVYNSIGTNKRLKSSADFKEAECTFKDLLSRTWGEVTAAQAISAYTTELKGILEEEDLAQIVRKIFSLQSSLNQLRSTVDLEAIPTLDSFYKNLSPVFLQVLYQYLSGEQNARVLDPEQVMSQWVAALRVALEEEYYLWQEKLLDL